MSICTAMLAITFETYHLHMASALVVCLLTLLWAHGVCDRANSSEAGGSGAPWVSRLFIATELGLAGLAALMLTVGLEVFGSAFGGVPALIVVPYFVCLWLASAALSRAESRGKAASGATLGTFLLMVYWVIGIWFVHPRLKRLDSA